MNFVVEWSREAEISFEEILQFLSSNWTSRETNSFLDRTEEIIQLLSQHPKIYPFSESQSAHKAVVHKNVSLFYKIQGSSIQLITFWDNRQDPEGLRINK